jgi:hypothetical protein
MSTTVEIERPAAAPTTQRQARCIDAADRVRRDIEREVIRGRCSDFDKKFMTDGLSLVTERRVADEPRALVTPAQLQRIGAALGPILAHVGK